MKVAEDEDLVLRKIAEGTARATGEEFFRSLVSNLALAIHSAYAFVAEFAGVPTRVRTLALWGQGRFLDNIEYDLAGTPCEDVVRGELCHHPHGVQQSFPEDLLLGKMGVESYLGVPLSDGEGQVLGHLAVLDTEPMSEEPRRLSIFKIFAARAAAELERLRIEPMAQASEEHLRMSRQSSTLLEINHAISRHLERDELFGSLAACLRDSIQMDRFGIELPIEGARLQGHLLTPEGSRVLPTQPHVLPAAGTACNWVLENRQWMVTDSRDELEVRFPVTFHVMSREGMESLCALPLMIGDRCRAVLFFMAAKTGAYRRIHRGFFDQVGGAVAVALDNCLAHEEVRRLRDQLAAENVYLREEIREEHNFHEILGRSPALLRELSRVQVVAPTSSNVLILGETGTGKELIARAIHNTSNRKDKPLIKLNCAALPTGLIESELFGHEKGAFTGALEKRVGRFALANGGTIFLDEIGDISPEVQVRLLRVLQDQEFEPVGSPTTVRVDVRVIAATNRDLERAVADGSFRADLYYRINVFPIHLPPLRQRQEDIPMLVHYFIHKYATKIGKRMDSVSPDTIERLVEYPWPGNIRELENVIERAVILSPGPHLQIDADLLRAPPAVHSTPRADAAALKPRTLAHAQREQIIDTLRRTRWVIDGERGAAKVLGLHPNTLRSRMKKLSIRREDA